MRRIITIAAFSALLAAAAPAGAAKKGEVVLLSDSPAAVVVGDTVWLAFTWQAVGDLEDFRVVARGTGGAVVAYPANTVDHSGPYQSTDLMDGEIDYTAVQIHVPGTGSGAKHSVLHLDASWVDGRSRRSVNQTVKIPLAVYDGRATAQLTDVVEVPAGEGAWVEVAYTGLAPLVDGFSVVVAADPALPITYPGYREATSLHHDDRLDDGETDVVRFFIDAATASPGDYNVGLAARYAGGLLEGDLTITVVP